MGTQFQLCHTRTSPQYMRPVLGLFDKPLMIHACGHSTGSFTRGPHCILFEPCDVSGNEQSFGLDALGPSILAVAGSAHAHLSDFQSFTAAAGNGTHVECVFGGVRG